MIPQSFIQDLLARTDIVDVVERYLTLKKGGANYFACCPFHGEKSASFSVSPTKQFYHCFGCGAHGNAISFLMEYSGLSFVEAVKDLAQQAGLSVPEEKSSSGVAAGTNQHDGLLEAITRAAQYYREQLKRHPAAIDYLKQRGVSGEVAAHFGMGYAPDGWQALAQIFPDYAASKTLAQAGLVIDNEQGRRYDRFRDRIIFPIQDRRGRVVAFGGRILATGEPKYLNSPETPLFEKGRELYGLPQAQKAIRDSGFALVVEGYMDVVALSQFGLQNAVATLGTATTAHHIHTLLRQTPRIVFCFDGDNAGRKAAWRALEAALEALKDDVTLAFLFLPEGHDPDSFIRTQGAEAMTDAAMTAMPLGEFLIEGVREGCPLNTAEGRAKFVHDARPLIMRIAAPLLRLQLIKRVAEISGLTQQEIESAFGLKPGRNQRTFASSPAHNAIGARNTARRRPVSPVGTLLRLVLQHPTWASRIPVDLISSHEAESRALVAIIDAASVGDIDNACGFGALIERFRHTPHGETLSNVAAELIDTDFDESVIETLFEDTLRKMHADAINREIVALTAQERQKGLSPVERHRLAELLIEKRDLAPVGKHQNF